MTLASPCGGSEPDSSADRSGDPGSSRAALGRPRLPAAGFVSDDSFVADFFIADFFVADFFSADFFSADFFSADFFGADGGRAAAAARTARLGSSSASTR